MKAVTVIETAQAPQAIGPYSQGVCFQNLVLLSGQIGLDPKTQELVSGFEGQCHQIFTNIGALLQQAGCDFTHVLKCHIYLTDLVQFNVLNTIMAQYIKEPYPARVVIGCNALPKGALVEVECTAIKSNK